MRRARYVGMRKVAAELHFKLMAYNLIRLDRMLREEARA